MHIVKANPLYISTCGAVHCALEFVLSPISLLCLSSTLSLSISPPRCSGLSLATDATKVVQLCAWLRLEEVAKGVATGTASLGLSLSSASAGNPTGGTFIAFFYFILLCFSYIYI